MKSKSPSMFVVHAPLDNDDNISYTARSNYSNKSKNSRKDKNFRKQKQLEKQLLLSIVEEMVD